MKNLFLFVVVTAFTVSSINASSITPYAQDCVCSDTSFNYTRIWREADSLREFGLIRESRAVVDVILAQARNEKNQLEWVKALLYKESLNSEFEESCLEESIKELKKELKILPEPAFQIISSALGELCLSYYTENDEYLLERSYSKADIDEPGKWTSYYLFDITFNSFRSSLRNYNLLISERVEDWSPVFSEGFYANGLSYTLYDVLSERALRFYTTNLDWNSNTSSRIVDDVAILFSPIKNFVLSQTSFDETSLFVQETIDLFKQLLTIHQNDSLSDFLVELDLRRLKWARHKGDSEYSDSLYIEGLRTLYNTFKNTPAGMSAGYELAYSIFRLDSYKYLSSFRNRLLEESVVIANEVIQKFPQSNGAKQCRLLLHEINLPKLVISTSDTYLPSEPFVFAINRKNCDSLYFRLVSISGEELRSLYLTGDGDLFKKYFSLKPYKEWNEYLPSATSLVMTVQEISRNSLPLGVYILFASSSSEFDTIETPVAYSLFQVTRLGWMQEVGSNLETHLVIIDRKTGKPEEDVEVLYQPSGNNKRSNEKLNEKIGKVYSDNNGFVRLLEYDSCESCNYLITLQKGRDYFSNQMKGFIRKKISKDKSKSEYKDVFFTDRPVYRPGQTVFFKGISYIQENFKYNVIADQSVRVLFLDPNDRSIDSLFLKTNSFGSFTGCFTIPNDIITGEYRISSPNGTFDIRVKEYKRPTFTVVLLPPQRSPRIGDTVEIRGVVEAFAGFPVQDGSVTYKITKQIWIPEDRSMIEGQESDIIEGETTTDKDGNFIIRFMVTPNMDLKNAGNLIYYYSVDADVVDQSGETHTGYYTISVSEQNLRIDVNIPERFKLSTDKSVKVRIFDLEGNLVRSKLTVEVFKLIQPDSSYWDLDLQDDFDFRYTNYYRSIDPSKTLNNWKVGSMVSVVSLNTSSDSLVYFDKLIADPGIYLIKFKAIDDSGKIVVREKRVIGFDEDSKFLPAKVPFWFYNISDEIKPNEPISFLLGTSEKNASMLLRVYKNDSLVENRWLTIHKGQRKVIVSIPSCERDKFSVTIAMVRNNHFYQAYSNISVIDDNNVLDVKFTTFRSMLRPNDIETWRVKVSKKDSSRFTSELLIGMYDASLDELAYNSWQLSLPIRYNTLKSWSQGSFSSNLSGYLIVDTVIFKPIEMALYPCLNWFDNVCSVPNEVFQNETIFGSIKNREVENSGFNGIIHYKILERYNNSNDYYIVGSAGSDEDPVKTYKNNVKKELSIRANLQETAFFLPQIQTNEIGEAEFSFTIPGSLTAWHVKALAHTAKLVNGNSEMFVKTQRQLMVIPQLPRFLRGGDTISIPVRIVNMEDKLLNITASFELLDIVSGTKLNWSPIDSVKFLSVKPRGTEIIHWNLIVPENPGIIVYRVKAKSDNYSDGEENVISVMSGKKWFITSQTKIINGQQQWQPNLTSGVSWKEAQDISLIIEYIENPTWYLIQSLTQVKSKKIEELNAALDNYYVSNIGLGLLETQPNLMNLIYKWSSSQDNISPLSRNEEVKIVKNDQRPWLQDAIDETNSYKMISDFFNETSLITSSEVALKRMMKLQLANGGFAWLENMPESCYLTEEVIQTLGRMKKLTVIEFSSNKELQKLVSFAIKYMDDRIIETYRLDSIRKVIPFEIEVDELKYLYSRSFWLNEIPLSPESSRIYKELLVRFKKMVFNSEAAVQAIAALVFFRSGDNLTAQQVIKSLKSKALYASSGSVYWRKNLGYLWFQDPNITQVLALEAFVEIENDKVFCEKIKSWLITQHQSESSSSRSASSEIIYAFLLKDTSLTDFGNPALITLNGRKLEPVLPSMLGSGWFKSVIYPVSSEELKDWKLVINGMGRGTGWANVWVNYRGDQSSSISSESGVKVTRSMFLLKSDTSLRDSLITRNSQIKAGDKLSVQFEITCDRDMEFVTVTDQRACGLEPLTTSGYYWGNHLIYYIEVKDDAARFFFNNIRKGTWVFNYRVVASHVGCFSDGPCEIQSIFSPALSGRSIGSRIEVHD